MKEEQIFKKEGQRKYKTFMACVLCHKYKQSIDNKWTFG